MGDVLDFLGEAHRAGFPEMDSDVLIIGGARILVVAEDGWGSLWGSCCLYLKRHFLAPVQIRSAVTDPSSCWH